MSFVAVVVYFVFPFLSSLGLMSCLFNNPLPLWGKSAIEFSRVLTSKRVHAGWQTAGLPQPGEVCKMFHCLGSLSVSQIDLEGLKERLQGGVQSQLWC